MASNNSSSEVIRILLIGRTGQGKSTTANSLVGLEDWFKESPSSKSETATCKWSKERTFLGRRVEVVDTPGIFDTESEGDNAKTHKELLKSLVLTIPGFHAIAYVPKCKEKITDEFKKTQDLFFHWFGPGVEKFTFVILTWCSLDNMKTEYIFNDPQSKLKELVEKCAKRVTIVENKGPQDLKNEQIKLIYKAVDDIKAANGHRCFNNLIYQLAQSYFQNKCPQKLTPDSIKLLKEAGLKTEIQDWLAYIDRNLFGNISLSTSEHSVKLTNLNENTDEDTEVFRDISQSTSESVMLPVLTENTSDETEFFGNISQSHSTSETSVKVLVSTEITDDETEKTCGNLLIYDDTTNERIPNTGRSTKSNLPQKDKGKTNIKSATSDEQEKMSDFANEMTTKQTSKRKPSSRKDRKIDYKGTANLDQAEIAKSNSPNDLSNRDSVTDTDVKNSVNNSDQVLTGFAKYLQTARNCTKEHWSNNIINFCIVFSVLLLPVLNEIGSLI